jgi:hypothetical protein
MVRTLSHFILALVLIFTAQAHAVSLGECAAKYLGIKFQNTSPSEISPALREMIKDKLPHLEQEIDKAIASSGQPVTRSAILIREALGNLKENLQKANTSTAIDRMIIAEYLVCLDFPNLMKIHTLTENPMESFANARDEQSSFDEKTSDRIRVYENDWVNLRSDYGYGKDPLMAKRVHFVTGEFSFRDWLNDYVDAVELVGVADGPAPTVDAVKFNFARSLSVHDIQSHALRIRNSDVVIMNKLEVMPLRASEFMSWKRRSIRSLLTAIDRLPSLEQRKWAETVLFYSMHEVDLSVPVGLQDLAKGRTALIVKFNGEQLQENFQTILQNIVNVYSYHQTSHQGHSSFQIASAADQAHLRDALTWLAVEAAKISGFN